MFAIFLMGMAILAILSGSFSYVLSIFDIFGISVIGFLIYYFVLARRKVLFWFLITVTLVIISSGI